MPILAMWLVVLAGGLVGLCFDTLTNIEHPAFYWSVGGVTGSLAMLSGVMVHTKKDN